MTSINVFLFLIVDSQIILMEFTLKECIISIKVCLSKTAVEREVCKCSH